MAYHETVLLQESIVGLGIKPTGVYVDLTYGGGGHSAAILKELDGAGRLLCFDKDADAIEGVPRDARVVGVRSDFRYLRHWLRYYGIARVDGVIADLGVSSHHFDTPERGFSYRADGPLDMRMNGAGERTAADLLNTMDREAISTMLKEYGEVKQAWAIACAIDEARRVRPLATIGQLLATVRVATQRERDDWGLLSQVFQALRIAVNDELGALDELLGQLPGVVARGGRVVIISYHSLEDRRVKRFFRGEGQAADAEAMLRGGAGGPFKEVSRGTVRPSSEEVERNPRARSARLRVGERQ